MTAGLEDGWYAVRPLDEDTLAIGEPLYAQRNWSYLIRGTRRALLFDTGSYLGDITGVLSRHARSAVTVLPSHMHYDHLGNVERLAPVSLPDLPCLRACADGGAVTPTERLFLGEDENRAPPRFTVSEWLPIGATIDLGGRELTLLHTPGHSPDSVSLWEPRRDRLYAADFLYPGPLYAQTPGASLRDYRDAARTLAATIGPETRILGAHGAAGPAGDPPLPLVSRADLEALVARLDGLMTDPPALAEGQTVTLAVSPALSLILGAEALPD